MLMKKITITALCALGLVASSQAALVANWTFDDASDLSGNTGSGATSWNSYSGVSQDAAGRFGGAASFTPSSSAWDNSFNLVTLDSFTVSLHVKGGTAWKDYLSIGTGNNVLVFEATSGASAIYNIGGAGGTAANSGQVVGATDVRDGEWHHLAVTVGNGTLTYYVDGIQEGSADFTGSGNATSLQIGSRFGQGGRQTTALIDDVSIYDEALDAAAINQLSGAAAVPEASSSLLMGLGGLALLLRRRK